MFPHARVDRHRLAEYLTKSHFPPIDVTRLIESCSTGWTVSHSNGLIHIKGVASFEEGLAHRTPQTGGEEVIPHGELAQLALHIAYAGFFPQLTSMAAYFQRESLAGSAFFTTLFGAVAWLIIPPAPFSDLFAIGRPDLAEMSRIMYMRWLQLCRSPLHIQAGVTLLLTAPWDFSSGTAPLRLLLAWSERCGVQMTQGTRPAKNRGVIAVNGCKALLVADRDMLFLACMFLFSVEANWSAAGVPADAPAPFAALAVAQPWLFGQGPAPALTLLDDVYPAQCAMSTDK